MSTQKPGDQWVAKSLVEVSRFFGVDRGTLLAWLQAGMPGNRGRYPLDQIAQWRLRTRIAARGLKRPRRAR